MNIKTYVSIVTFIALPNALFGWTKVSSFNTVKAVQYVSGDNPIGLIQGTLGSSSAQALSNNGVFWVDGKTYYRAYQNPTGGMITGTIYSAQPGDSPDKCPANSTLLGGLPGKALDGTMYCLTPVSRSSITSSIAGNPQVLMNNLGLFSDGKISSLMGYQ